MRVTLNKRERVALANRIREARARAKLDGVAVQKRTGIHPSTLSFIENAQQEPTLGQLRALARVFADPDLDPLHAR